jgi:CxxC motif-containing protein (DUF1111 family)
MKIAPRDLRDRPNPRDKRLEGQRVCLLRGRDARVSSEHWGQCTDNRHRHVSAKLAQEMVGIGQWEWVTRAQCGKRAKPGDKTQRAVRVVMPRVWRKTMSRDGYGSVATMQLVSGV